MFGHFNDEERGPGFGGRMGGMQRKRMLKRMFREWQQRGFGPPMGRGDRPEEQDPFWGAPKDRGGPFGRPGGPFGAGGPFGGNPFDEDGGGRQRQRRGDIKYALLELLADQPRHGYELIKELEQRYGGFYRPSPGSVYPTLQLLEDEGHLTSEQVTGKRVYTITESGRQLLATHREQRGPEREGHGPRGHHGHGGDLGELRRAAMGLAESVMQAGRHGTPEQVQAVMALLANTRREVYKILAQEEKGERAE